MSDTPPFATATTDSPPAGISLPSSALTKAAEDFATSKNSRTILYRADGSEAFVLAQGEWYSVTMQEAARD